MKLDKIEFGRLIAFLSRNGFDGYENNIRCLDEMVDIEMPEAVPVKVSCVDVDYLLAFMSGGCQKIEAIKAYRHLTGAGLKESKDAVEKYWISRNAPDPSNATLGDILNKAGK